MSWRDYLMPGSIGGVPFKTLSHQALIGRKTALHEYPWKDLPYSEDLGRASREFTLFAFVIANAGNRQDYITERNDLVEVFDGPGPYLLVHPYYGEILVACAPRAKVNIEETADEGGQAKFTIPLVQVEESQFPAPAVPPTEESEQAQEEAEEEHRDWFASMFDIFNRILLARAALADITAVFDFMRSIASGFSLPAIYDALIGDLIDQAGAAAWGDIWGDAGALFDTITGPFSGFADAAEGGGITDGAAAIRGMTGFMEFTGARTDIRLTSPSRHQQAKNRSAVVNVTRNMALVTATRMAATVKFHSATEAMDSMRRLVTAINLQQARAAGDDPAYDDGSLVMVRTDLSSLFDDRIYNAMENLKGRAVRAMRAAGADLSRILVPYTTTVAVRPTLVLAYDLYEDVGREQEIIDRNAVIQHPGFPPGGVTLEVLSK